MQKDVPRGTATPDPWGKKGWSQCEGAEGKARKGEEGPVAGRTEEKVTTDAAPEGGKEEHTEGVATGKCLPYPSFNKKTPPHQKPPL